MHQSAHFGALQWYTSLEAQLLWRTPPLGSHNDWSINCFTGALTLDLDLSLLQSCFNICLPRSKCSAFPVHQSAPFGALHWYTSLEAQCTSLLSALHSPLKYIHFKCDFAIVRHFVDTSHCSVVCTAPTLQCSSVVAAYALQRSCIALKYCTAQALPMHCTCSALRSGKPWSWLKNVTIQLPTPFWLANIKTAF